MTVLQAPERIMLGPEDGEAVAWGGFGARFMLDAGDTGGAFALVEHPIAPRTLASPLHTHAHEDEWSFVLEGEVGFQVAETVRHAGPGTLVFKPRGIPHAFWNRSDAPARVLELIAPPAFARYFADIAPLLPPKRAEPDVPALAAVQARYGLTMDLDSIEPISRREGLPLPEGG
jgi:uncharacterized cupin superfamily protein